MRILLVINLIIAFCVGSFAQSNLQKISLQEVKALALSKNTEVLNAKLETQIAQKKVWETLTIGLPQVSATFSHNYFLELPVTLIPANTFNPLAAEDEFMEMKFGTEHNSKLDFQATQLLFSGEYIVGLRASNIYKRLSQQQLEKTEQDVVDLVSNTYLLVLIAQERTDNIKGNIKSTKSLLKETQAMLQAGFVESTDVDQLQINLSRLENALLVAQRQIDLSKNLLKVQLNMSLNTPIELTDRLEPLIQGISVSELGQTQLAVEQTVEYKMSETNLKLQKLNMEREMTAFLPKLSLFFTYQKNLQNNDFVVFKDEKWYPTKILGLNISMPIFSSGQRLAKVSQAKIALSKARNSHETISKQLELKVIEARNNFLNASERLVLEGKNKALSQKIFDNMSVKYKNGMARSLELTQSQMQWLSTQDAYYQAVFSLMDSKNKLERALGILKVRN